MCNGEGCSERAQVLAEETDQGRESAGRSGSGAARVVPVERLEELAAEFVARHDRLTFAAANASTSEERNVNAWSSRAEAWSIAAGDLRAVIADHAADAETEPKRTSVGTVTVDLHVDTSRAVAAFEAAAESLRQFHERRQTTRSGFTGRGESDGTAPEAPESTPDDSAGAESVVELAARVLHAWDVEDGPCAGPWEALTDAQREVWRSGARVLADAGLLADPEEPDPEACGVESRYGLCDRPKHEGDHHAVFIGGNGDPFDDPDMWFVWGGGLTPDYYSARLFERAELTSHDQWRDEAEKARARVADLEAEVERLRSWLPPRLVEQPPLFAQIALSGAGQASGAAPSDTTTEGA